LKTYLTLVLLTGSLALGHAVTTINTTNHFAYGANFGWIDWRGDVANGAVIGAYACSGYLYAANVGWINLGSGSPTDGIRYQNIAGDCGVNLSSLGSLSGWAWGANIGWINFGTNGLASVDLDTGKFSGYAWSANCGWISLSNFQAFVQTDSLYPGPDTDNNGLPDPWERDHFGHIGVDPNADPDNDSSSTGKEYAAGTDPNNGTDYLRITSYSFGPEGTSATLTWTSTPTRRYYIHEAPRLVPPSWADSGLGRITPDGASTTRTFPDSAAPMRVYRVEAVPPLAP
jgi:hypothetical protein